MRAGAERSRAVLTLALSKGRISNEAAPLLARAGIGLEEDPAGSRRLCIATSLDDVRVLVLRAQDVPTFVEHGAADLGIAGKDVLLEYRGGGLYEPLDLGIARCRLVLAEPRDAKPAALRPRVATNPRPRVATKYVETARRFFAGKGVQAEIIRLYGSMEIAPAAGLADCIVDLVDTGATLAANGLVVREEIAAISARLVVNKAAMKLSHGRVSALVERIGRAVAQDDGFRACSTSMRSAGAAESPDSRPRGRDAQVPVPARSRRPESGRSEPDTDGGVDRCP